MRRCRSVVAHPQSHLLGRTVADAVASAYAHFEFADCIVDYRFCNCLAGISCAEGIFNVVEADDIVEFAAQRRPVVGCRRKAECYGHIACRRRVIGHVEVGHCRRCTCFRRLSEDKQSAEFFVHHEVAHQRCRCRCGVDLIKPVCGVVHRRPVEFARCGVERCRLRVLRHNAGVAHERQRPVALVDGVESSGTVDAIHFACVVGCHEEERAHQVGNRRHATVYDAHLSEHVAVHTVVDEAAVHLLCHRVVG